MGQDFVCLHTIWAQGFLPIFQCRCILNCNVLFLYVLKRMQNFPLALRWQVLMLKVESQMILWSVCLLQASWTKQESLQPLTCRCSLLLKVMVSFFLPLHALHCTINFVPSSVKDLILSMYFPFPFLIMQSVKADMRMETAIRKCFSIYVMYIMWLKILSVCSFHTYKKFQH